jgi:hypothetical protein
MTVAEVVTVVPAAPVAETILPEHIDEVRKHVDAEFQDQCDDETVKRFIRATSGHVHLGGHLHLVRCVSPVGCTHARMQLSLLTSTGCRQKSGFKRLARGARK